MRQELRFEDVDGLAFATARGRLDDAALAGFEGQRLGPLMELAHQAAVGMLSAGLQKGTATGALGRLVNALGHEDTYWSGPDLLEDVGFVRTAAGSEAYEAGLMTLLVRARAAGQRVAGLSKVVAGQLVAAMRELESNVHEHAEAPDSGVVAYRAEAGAFEFVVADRGIGVIESLRRSGEYGYLRDEGTALRAALTEGVSRYGRDVGRGLGFRPMFQGLVDLYGELRFRSGDHAVTMDGVAPEVATARIAQKARMAGFFASVRCHARPEPRGTGC